MKPNMTFVFFEKYKLFFCMDRKLSLFIGTITDGAIRDVDEMCNAGFKGIASRMCVGHAWSWPVRWNCEVFGVKVKPGQLIHADKHGFLIIPEEDQERILEASRFMDSNVCKFTLTI